MLFFTYTSRPCVHSKKEVEKEEAAIEEKQQKKSVFIIFAPYCLRHLFILKDVSATLRYTWQLNYTQYQIHLE